MEYVFVRGSGTPRNISEDWLQFKKDMMGATYPLLLKTAYTDLDYPAVSIFNVSTAIGAKITGGEYTKYGESVAAGVKSLTDYYLSVQRFCPYTKWVIVGYSQGASVVGKAAKYFSANDLVLVGLIADPNTYLPEGKGGRFSKACKGEGFSDYRYHVEDCRTYKGGLGARIPYVHPGLEGRYALWCNKDDYVCGSSKTILNTANHGNYDKDRTYKNLGALTLKKLEEMNVKPMDYIHLLGSGLGASMEVLSEDEYFVESSADEFELEMPVEVTMKRDDSGVIELNWETWPDGAKYLLVELNGFDLGLVEVDDRYAEVSELPFDEGDILNVAWVNDGFTVGDERDLDLAQDYIAAGDVSSSLTDDLETLPADIVEELPINVDTVDMIESIIRAIAYLSLAIMIAFSLLILCRREKK